MSREQATASGLTRSAIRHKCDTRRWRPVLPGVFRLAGAIETPKLRAMAAVLGGGAGAVLSHTSAAALLGVPGFAIDPTVISIPRARRGLPGVRIEQSLALPAHHLRQVDGIPCTSVARTIFDLCGDVHARRAERALDTAVARRLVTLPALWRVLDDLAVQGRSGSVLMRTLLTERGPRYAAPESELESRFIELVERWHLPPPERQVDLGDADSWIGRVDFVWRSAALVVEVDGAMFHDALLDRRRDHERETRLDAAGWTTLRFRWHDVVHQPDRVAAEVRARLRPGSIRGGIGSPLRPGRAPKPASEIRRGRSRGGGGGSRSGTSSGPARPRSSPGPARRGC